MLIEKVPIFYGSGVIPKHFNEIKSAIKKLILEEFLEGEAFDEMIESLTLQAQEESLSNLK